MEFTGLGLGPVLGVLAAFGVAVVALYLLKLRRRRVRVPFVPLWESVLAEKRSTRLFSQLKRWLSLLVALSIVALLALSLGDPRFAGATREGRSIVVLVDASASMQAHDAAPTRLDAARVELRRLIDELGPADRMLIAQMDSGTTPLTPLTTESAVLREAVDRIAPTDLEANADVALALALDVLRSHPEPEILFIGDGGSVPSAALEARLEEDGTRLSWIRVGSEQANVGISAFSVRRYPLDKSQAEVLMEIWNPGEEASDLELTLKGDGETVEVQTLRVEGGERLQRFYRNISGVDSSLTAELRTLEGSVDFLEADDRAYAELPRRRRARVLVVSEGNLYLEAALLLDEYLDVTALSPSDYSPSGEFDVVVFDGWLPPSTPPWPALYLHPEAREGGESPLEIRGSQTAPYFQSVDRRHPLVRWTALGDVNIAEALDVGLGRGDRAVARAPGGPLIVTGRREGRRFVVFTFDIRQSDLPLRVAWPLLLLNTIDFFVAEGDGYLSSFRAGESWRVPLPSGGADAVVIDPSGRERAAAVAEGHALTSGSRAGIYTLRSGESERTFAVNLAGDRESVIGPAETLVAGERVAGPPSEGEAGLRRRLWLYFVAIALGILALEWLSYHRRLTV